MLAPNEAEAIVHVNVHVNYLFAQQFFPCHPTIIRVKIKITKLTKGSTTTNKGSYFGLELVKMISTFSSIVQQESKQIFPA